MRNVSRAVWKLFTLFLLLAIRSAVSIDPCSFFVQTIAVATTDEATDLATALNCSGGGYFDVAWEGAVIVNKTIALTDGSVVTITGDGPGAIADGGGLTQLFTVVNSTLNLADISLENGDGFSGDNDGFFGGTNGGAVWAGGVDSVVSCSGTTAFSNNIASNGGAVSIENGAVGFFSGDTLFTGNTADSVYGGAVLVANGASVSWSGHTNFTLNSAPIGGGALFAVESDVTWTEQTTFADNSANVYGGTILARFSNVSWSGVTSFKNSTLRARGESGGTVQVEDSVLSWEGEASFDGGSGGVGGALHAARSNISWTGETFFCDNSADIRGGALSIESSSNVSWTGETQFSNNRVRTYQRGGQGGAINVVDSTVSWDGATTFTNNSAESGGAVHGRDGASMAWNGNTTFAINSAVTGGAVYGESGAIMAWGGATTFRENTASTDGGAVAFFSQVSLDLAAAGTTLSLIGNVADISGGAVYQSSNSYGLTWEGVNFTANSALNGGAVYSAASGIAVEGIDRVFPNVYVNCSFRGNKAGASGGAVESAAGKDTFLYTTFNGNTAGALGGGLRMAGTCTLTSCDFVGNGANGSGPAVANVGTMVVSNTSFTKNNLLCTPGAFLNYTVQGADTANETALAYYRSVCEGCELCSGDCPMDGNGTQQCIPAYENTKSIGVDASGLPITLETLEIDQQYWRSVSSSVTILPCWNEDACLGGITGKADYCADGYTGPCELENVNDCALCTGGYAATLAYTCSKCSSGEGVAFAVVALLAALAAAVAIFVHLASKPLDRKNMSFRKLMQDLPVQGLKTVVVVWQILTQFDSVANVTYAGVYGQFLDGIASLINFDLGLVLSAGCMVTTDFHDRLIVATLGPLVALGAIGGSFQVAARRNHGSHEALQTVRRKHFSMALLVTFLIYSSVSSTVFRMFACEPLDGGKEYLRADYSIECTTDKHKALQVYAGFMIMVYPVGIPLTYAIILFKHREVLKHRHHHSVQQSAGLEATADLWKPYTPSRYYYEVVECARRVMLTGVVVFIYPNTAAQVAITLVLVFVFVMVSEALSPYASKQDSWMSRVAHIVVYLSMFQALVVKVDVSDERSGSQEVFGGVLLAANICMVAAVLVEAAMVVYSVCGRGGAALGESVAPGVRNSTINSVVERWDMIDDDAGPTYQDATS